MVSETTGAFVSISVVLPKSSTAHCILHRFALVSFFLKQGCLRDVLNEVVKITYFTESLCLNMHLFHILCDVMGSTCKALLLHPNSGCTEEKHLCELAIGWTSHSCHRIPFLLKRTTDKYLVDIF